MSYRRTLVNENKDTMKTFTFRWLICLSLLFFVTPCLYAQRFMLSDMFRGWGKDAKEGVLKKYTSEEQNGHQWILETDGKNGDYMNNKSMLHIGTSKWPVTKTVLTSCNEFDNVDTILVRTDSKAPYTVSLSINNKPVESKKVAKNADIRVLGFSVKGASGKVEVLMKYDESLKQAMSIYYIEVISRLSDIVALSSQHIKPGDTYSYQVQRTFASDHWNTICLPFKVSKETLAEVMGENCSLREFTKKVKNNVLEFENADAIQAGVPYLIKPVRDVVNPIFSNVTYVKNIEPKAIEDINGQFAFVGTFDPVNLSVDGSELFLLANGNLAKPKSEEVSEMYGMRAYFKINEQTSSSAKQITYAIDCGSETVNGIQSLPVHPSTHNQHIYNLQGVDVGTDIHHLPAGVYVMGGKKIIKR